MPLGRRWLSVLRTRPARGNLTVLLACLVTSIGIILYLFPRGSRALREHASHDAAAGAKQSSSPMPPVPCTGPRGKPILDSPDDLLHPQRLNVSYPTPFSGSYDALNLQQEWLTIDGRYGPYGLPSGRSYVEWSQVDWAGLQHACQQKNAARFKPSNQQPFTGSDVRMHLRPEAPVAGGDTYADTFLSWITGIGSTLGFSSHAFNTISGPEISRTALLMRTYDDYKYTEEDRLNIRSLVSEASLQSGGEYTVILYVNIRNASKEIWSSPEKYNHALDDTNVPAEFRHLAVLWDEPLLQSWYPDVEEHSIYYQITQATQLFALFYQEFDHYWQLEMDMRSLGHTLNLLRSIDDFARQEPRKQAWERASYLHLPDRQGSYADFTSAVNASLEGGASVWGPAPPPEIEEPIGPQPPVADPRDDHFDWGVGEPADLVVTNPCAYISRMRTHPFRSWLVGPWSLGLDTPRITCPPAVQRASRQLLLAVHRVQAKQGLAVPSEATLPSFALWHGLKVSAPPLPHFRGVEMDGRVKEIFYNGGKPGECVKLASRPNGEKATLELEKDIREYLAQLDSHNGDPEDVWNIELESIPMKEPQWSDRYRGFGCGEVALNQEPRVQLTDHLSWWWRGGFPRKLITAWSKNEWKKRREEGAVEELGEPEVFDAHRDSAGVLVERGGEVWAPAGWLHPVKTN